MPSPPNFPQFLKLPEEVREIIYKQHLWDTLIGSGRPFGPRPIEPPISRASLVLRKETIPLFYDLYVFRLQTEMCGGGRPHGQRPPGRPEWHHRLGGKVAHINVLLLHFMFEGEHMYRGQEDDEPFSLDFGVRLYKRQPHYHVACDDGEIEHGDQALAFSTDDSTKSHMSKLILRELKRVLDRFVAEDKIGRLNPQDFDELVNVCFAVEDDMYW